MSTLPKTTTEYRSVLWGSFVNRGEKVVQHASLQDAIDRVLKIDPLVRMDINNGLIDFYTTSNEMVATVRCYLMKLRLSPWTVVPGAPHCCMRFVEHTDPLQVANRVAFIEKTPRVRIAPYSGTDLTDGINWQGGPKGSGGHDGDKPENELYGFYPPSRQWCDEQLRQIGYELAEDK